MRGEAWQSMSSESYSRLFPERISRKVHNEGTSAPAAPERMALRGTLRLTRCSGSSWKDTAAF
jgi:hypothetical protein